MLCAFLDGMTQPSLKAPDGSKNVPVGKIIALVAESDDDLNNLEIPKDDASEKLQPTQTPKQANSTQQSDSSPKSLPPIHDVQIHHSRPLFPSVQRLLLENGISNADEIKGTGVRGMLTKGDVLAFLGKASSPLGTYKEAKPITPSPIKEEDTKVTVLTSHKLACANMDCLATRWVGNSPADCQ